MRPKERESQDFVPFLLKYSSGSLGWGEPLLREWRSSPHFSAGNRGSSEQGASHRDALEGALGCQRDAEFNSEAQQKSQEECKTEAAWQVLLLRSCEAALADVERKSSTVFPAQMTSFSLH